MPTSGAYQFPLRMPSEMSDRIRANAEANRRSMNSEIVHYLDRALASEETKSPAGTAIPPGQGHQRTLENADGQDNS